MFINYIMPSKKKRYCCKSKKRHARLRTYKRRSRRRRPPSQKHKRKYRTYKRTYKRRGVLSKPTIFQPANPTQLQPLMNELPTSNKVILYKNIIMTYTRPLREDTSFFRKYTDANGNAYYRSSIMGYGKSISFSFGVDNYTRYHINKDGHCLFDSLSYSFLFYKQRDNQMQSTKCWFEERGWNPSITNTELPGTGMLTKSKGNLMDIILTHETDIITEIMKFYSAMGKEEAFMDGITNMVRIFQNYLARIRHDYSLQQLPTLFPSKETLDFIFPLMFDKERYKLCIFEGNYRDGHIVCGNTFEETCTSEKGKTTVYIWYTGDHFEPVLKTRS